MRIMSVKTALEAIKPDERLIYDTQVLLRSKGRKKKFSLNKLVLAACMPVILGLLFISIYIYNLPVSFISVDVNPSLELGINRFDRVVAINYYNSDAENLIPKKEIYLRKPDEAIDAIMASLGRDGYLSVSNATVIAIAVNCEEPSDSDKLLAECTRNLNNYVKPISIVQYTADDEFKAEADRLSISFGKLKLIKMIQQLDKSATIKDLQSDSVASIMEYLSYLTSEKYTGADEDTKNSMRVYIESIQNRIDSNDKTKTGIGKEKAGTEKEDTEKSAENTEVDVQAEAREAAEVREVAEAEKAEAEAKAAEARAAAEAEKAEAEAKAAEAREAAEAEKVEAEAKAAEAREAAEAEKAEAEAKAAEAQKAAEAEKAEAEAKAAEARAAAEAEKVEAEAKAAEARAAEEAEKAEAEAKAAEAREAAEAEKAEAEAKAAEARVAAEAEKAEAEAKAAEAREAAEAEMAEAEAKAAEAREAAEKERAEAEAKAAEARAAAEKERAEAEAAAGIQ